MINKYCKEIGVAIPEILMPEKHIDLSKWSVVACDQYTSQLEYWQQARENVGDNPSTLNIIFPEVYLEDDDANERIESINATMNRYLTDSIFASEESGFIYIEREVEGNRIRKGLIVAIDLEQYDYTQGSQTLIRATEGTVLDRLPPRIRIRENAALELPHIMLLIDDSDRTVIEPLAEKISMMEKLYDFNLMMDSGNIKGYRIKNDSLNDDILNALKKLADQQNFQSKYKVNSDKGVLLFAVGDGNHSLATAKACWDKIRNTLSEKERENHPARFALVEVVNVHDDALLFEPIHRAVFNIQSHDLLEDMMSCFNDKGMNAHYHTYMTKEAMETAIEGADIQHGEHVISFVTDECYGVIFVKNPTHQLEVATLQVFLDDYIKNHASVKIDYIHGEEVVEKLGLQKGNIGFWLPAMSKYDLFKTVIFDGALPRKTFSMGEAHEKRFYLECKKIR